MRLLVPLLCIVLTSFSLPSLAQDCAEPFVFFYGENADYGARTLLAQDSFLFVGGFRDEAALLAKLTLTGEVLWVQTMQPYPNLPHVIVDLKIDSEGALIGVGQARQDATIESFAFKLNPADGAISWTQTYADPATGYYVAADIYEPVAGGNYVLLGSALNTNNPGLGCDATFYSLNRNTGNLATERIHYHLGSCESIEAAVVRNGNFYVTGRYNFAGGGLDKMRAAVSSFNSTGTAMWSRLYLVNVLQNARMYSSDISLDGANNLVVLAHGDDNGTLTDNNDIWLFRTNLSGGAQWALKYTFPEAVSSQEVLVVENGYVLVASANAGARTYLTRVNGAGTVIWAKRLDGLLTRGTGDELTGLGAFIYLAAQHVDAVNNHAALLRLDLATGNLPSACIPNAAVQLSQQIDSAPYDGFNALSPYNTQVAGAGSFAVAAAELAPLPISCAPDCGAEICENGIDDDNDGLVDCDDPDLADDCCCYVPPVLSLPNDTTICAGTALLLNAGEGYSSYRWSDLSTGATLTVTTTGTYAVSVTDRCGTIQMDSLQVTLAEPVTTTVMAGFCPGGSVEVEGLLFSEAGTYTTILVGANGCDSTHVITVIELATATTSAEATICAGETITLFGEAVSQSGVYSGTLTGSNGCDSVHTIVLSVLETMDTAENIAICSTGSAEVFGATVTEAGVYSRVFTGANGCDSTHTITVTVTPSILTSENIVLCPGETVVVFGESVGEAGIYSTLLAAANGCDSTHTIFVDVLDPVMTTETIQICPGGSALIFGNNENLPGDYSQTVTGSNGCDSTHTILLEVLDNSTTSETITICASASILLFGTPTSTAGDYSMTFTGSNGCDSVHTVTLVVNPPVATSEVRTLCAGTTTEVFGQTIGERGDYSMTFTTTAGCDSIHTISVVVLDPIATSETISGLCSGTSIEVFGQAVTEAGQYQQTFTTAQGCDSIHTVVVGFLPPNATRDTLTICLGESVEVFGTTVTEPGIYQNTSTAANGCDSTHTVLLQNETFVGSANIFPPCPSDPDRWIVYIRTRGDGGPYVVTWNGEPIFGNTINGVPIGDHIAQVTSANGCVYEVPFTVRPYNRPWTALAMAPGCTDPQSGAIRIELAPTDETLSFSLDGEHFSTEPLFAGLSAGTYKLYVNYGARCTLTDTITVPGAASLVLELPEDQVIPWGTSLPIEPQTTAGPGATFRWTPAATLDCTTCEKVVAKPLETTRYRLSVTNAAGCLAEDEMLVRVARKSHYFVPNAFSPNGDGHNDYFTLFAEATVAEITYLAVYDRWGEQVFVRTNFLPNDEQTGWNGQVKAQPAAPGTYVYYAELKLIAGELIQVKGDVTLLR
ncbi:MAG: hypothetical protein DA408_07005 [Bacteroidetes bacterium]|nr:MAG: hypothetical protein DA408_07005 [Bacteroidota bacterium]